MAENQGIEQVLGKLVELLSAKRDEVPSSSKENVVHTEPVQKIELMPNDIKLEGIKNYLAWSRRTLRLLKAKRLEGFISGDLVEPTDKSSTEWKDWDATNSLVAAWMLNSMTPAIASTVDTIMSVAEIWKALETMYSGAGNVMLMVEIEDRLHGIKQGERSVREYVAELQHLWADADHYDPIELPHSECVAWVKKWIEKRRVLQFLRGLNPEFEARRAAMFHQSTLPSLQEAIAAMSQEESRQKVMIQNDSPSTRPIFAATRKEARECFNCGDTGHFIRDCPKPLKSNRGRGRGSGRGVLRGGRGRGGRSSYRANAATSVEELEAPFIGREDQLQLKERIENRGNKDLESHSGDFINFAYTNEGEKNWEESWDCNQA